MEDIKKKRVYNKKVKTDEGNPTVKSGNSLSNIIENEKNSYKYTKHGAIRASWIRDEAKREKAGNNDIIAIRVKEELLRLEQKKAKEDEKERLKQEKKRDVIRLREEKKAKIKSEKIDMRGKTEKALAHNKKQGSRLQQGIYMKMKKKEEERRRKENSDTDHGSEGSDEEITTTIIRKKRSKSRTPDIDYRKYYEDSIKKKTIKEEDLSRERSSYRVEDSSRERSSVPRGQSPNIDHIRRLQQNIFKGIL